MSSARRAAGSRSTTESYSIAAKRSSLVVWDASTFPSEPVAKVALPHRVPNGLHGNWMPGEG